MDLEENPKERALVSVAGETVSHFGASYGASIYYRGEERTVGGFCECSSNEEREVMKAVIAVLETLPANVPLTISGYTLHIEKPLRLKWVDGWRERNWRRTDGRTPIKNGDLWRAMSELVPGRDIAWNNTAAHIEHELFRKAGSAGRRAFSEGREKVSVREKAEFEARLAARRQEAAA